VIEVTGAAVEADYLCNGDITPAITPRHRRKAQGLFITSTGGASVPLKGGPSWRMRHSEP
jgi:hypothetical protein